MANLFDGQYANLASKGRYGDTMLAHINPQEAGLLTAMGGAGTINPQTGLREFFTLDPRVGGTDAPKQYEWLGGKNFNQTVAEPFDRKFADVVQGGYGSQRITGYTLPTGDKKYADIPLEAKYDPQGNFKFYALQAGKYLTPDPNLPNIKSFPKINLNGEVEDWGIVDVDQLDNGSFGSVVRDIVSNVGDIALAALAGYALSGSSILSGFGASATGGVTGAAAQTLGPYAAQAAGAYGAGGAAAQGLLTTAGATAAEIAAANTLAKANIAGGLTTDAVTRAAAAGFTVTPSILQSIANATGISVDTLKTLATPVIQGLVGLTGSVISADKATDAATTQANAITQAAQIAADAARFRPVGVTTRFGSSKFTTDEKGNVITAGYTPSAEITGYQDRLKTLAGQGMTDIEGARAAYQPLTGAAQNLFTLGRGYLAPSPEQVAADYISKQTALLSPSRDLRLSNIRNIQEQQGRGGLSVAQGGNLMATNPELAAYYNSIAQENLTLAAQADQDARNRIQFGAGLFDTGANLQNRFYSGQTAAYAPFTTAIDTSSGLERLAQQPLDLSTSIGQRVSTANANVGQLTSQGITTAASTMAPANAYSAAGNLFTGAAQSPVFASALNKAFGNTQQPTQQTFTFNPATGQYIPVQSAII